MEPDKRSAMAAKRILLIYLRILGMLLSLDVVSKLCFFILYFFSYKIKGEKLTNCLRRYKADSITGKPKGRYECFYCLFLFNF